MQYIALRGLIKYEDTILSNSVNATNKIIVLGMLGITITVNEMAVTPMAVTTKFILQITQIRLDILLDLLVREYHTSHP